VPRANSLETNGAAASLTRAISSRSSASAVCTLRRRKAVAQRSLIVRPALRARPAQPRVELVLHRTLDHQSGAQLGRLRQRLARVLTDTHAKQPIELLLDPRRRGTARLTA
jgi:hypothetical protein